MLESKRPASARKRIKHATWDHVVDVTFAEAREEQLTVHDLDREGLVGVDGGEAGEYKIKCGEKTPFAAMMAWWIPVPNMTDAPVVEATCLQLSTWVVERRERLRADVTLHSPEPGQRQRACVFTVYLTSALLADAFDELRQVEAELNADFNAAMKDSIAAMREERPVLRHAHAHNAAHAAGLRSLFEADLYDPAVDAEVDDSVDDEAEDDVEDE